MVRLEKPRVAMRMNARIRIVQGNLSRITIYAAA